MYFKGNIILVISKILNAVVGKTIKIIQIVSVEQYWDQSSQQRKTQLNSYFSTIFFIYVVCT